MAAVALIFTEGLFGTIIATQQILLGYMEILVLVGVLIGLHILTLMSR